MSYSGVLKARFGHLIMLALVCLALLPACAKSKKGDAKKAKSPVPVLVAKAGLKDVPIELHAIGNVEAYSTVSIKSQVGGEVTGVSFSEGKDVKKGDLLFTIDRRPLEADLKRAEGILARDIVQSENTKVDAGRYEDLYKKGAVSKQQYDQVITAVSSFNETINTDKAAIESIKVQLGYTRIYSPIDGRTGALNVNRGNVVKANDVPLVVINQLRPVYATFSVPDKFLSEVQKLSPRGRLKVTACVNGSCRPATGYLSFVDNAVDPNTGSIKLKATFDNGDRKLWPGQFVDVVLIFSTRKGATVVPSQAVQTGQSGQFVFVVKPDNTVESRPVVTGVMQDGFTVVEHGIKPGESVVTDGQLRVTPGTKVEVKAGL